MRQPEVTKERILKESGELFNTRGYKSTSLRDITRATGLTKGAIYRHFKNKDDLEREALLFLAQVMFGKLRVKIKNQETAPEKLRAMFTFFETYITNPPVKGGCPLLNVSTEADDAHPILRKQAVIILDLLHQSITTIITNGIKFGQIKSKTDTAHYASLIIAMLEGAIMMSKLRGNNHDIKRATQHLDLLIAEIEMNKNQKLKV
jgi:TetR/AcrR family transcriptional regulator, transcriptional repressor for nem operon